MSLAVGARLGPYEIISAIGAGGMGEVYRARDTKLGRDVAIKILPASVAHDPERLQRLEREARLLASLNHPNIGAIYGFEQNGDTGALVLELIEGDTLAERLRRGPIPIKEALSMAVQIADAVDAAHERGIVHRDLKPANIKITRVGSVKVLDFGLAKMTAGAASGQDLSASPTMIIDRTREGAILGTAAYMSPEQARGQNVDKRTDIWSLGCVIYEMLAGRAAFARETVTDTLAAIVEREPDWQALPPTIGPSLRRLLQRCLEKDLTRRLRDAADARFAIEDSLADTDWSPASLPARVDKPTRARWWAAAALIAMLTVSAVSIWGLASRRSIWRNPLDGATFTRLTDFEGVETDAVISPDGNFVAFISDQGGPLDVWVLQLGSGQFLDLTQGKISITSTQIRTLGFSSDGSRVLFTTNRPNADGSTSPGTSIVPAIGGPIRTFMEGRVDPQWSVDGGRLLFFSVNGNRDQVYVADRDGASAREVFPSAPNEHNHFMTWSLDGQYVYFVRSTRNIQENDIWRAPARGGEPERLTHHNAWVGNPTLLDDQTLLYVANDENNTGTWLYAMDLDRRDEHRVSAGIEQYLSIAATVPAPGRLRRLVATMANPTGGLWTVPISGAVVAESAARPYPVTSPQVSSPRFGPDYLLYLSSRELADGLWKLQGKTATELWKPSDGAVMAAPAVSGDGRQIAMSVLKQGRAALYVMTADGANPRPLATSLDVRESPSWSPDGLALAVTGYDRQGPGLFVVPVDGSAPSRLNDRLCYLPAWSPDGRYILFAEYFLGRQMEVKAITPDGKPYPLFPLRITQPGVRSLSIAYRFFPDGKSLLLLDGQLRKQQFSLVNLETGAKRPLTDLRPGRLIRGFDITPDGKSILFDRVQENADIVLIDLPKSTQH